MPSTGRRRRWHFVAVLILTATTVAGCGGVLFLARAWFVPGLIDQGLAAYDRGDWSMAAALAEACLKSTPGDRQALRLLARSSVRQGQDKRARTLYARLGGAAEMQPEDYYLFGTVIDRLGDHETARECWEQGLRADPDHAGLLFEIAARTFGWAATRRPRNWPAMSRGARAGKAGATCSLAISSTRKMIPGGRPRACAQDSIWPRRRSLQIARVLSLYLPITGCWPGPCCAANEWTRPPPR